MAEWDLRVLFLCCLTPTIQTWLSELRNLIDLDKIWDKFLTIQTLALQDSGITWIWIMLYPLRSAHVLSKLKDRRDLDNQGCCVSTRIPPDHGIFLHQQSKQSKQPLSLLNSSSSQKSLIYWSSNLKCASIGSVFSLLIILSGAYLLYSWSYFNLPYT